MATAAQLNEPASQIESLIRPAILKLVSESEGAYRCERDLHHHFTVCLDSIRSLELGTQRRRVFMERPALACYGKGSRRGNLDYFFPGEESGPYRDRVFLLFGVIRAAERACGVLKNMLIFGSQHEGFQPRPPLF
jgi:hypothetical protein